MTTITVLDTSVAADLHKGGLLDALFKLPMQYTVPDVMFADEFEGWFGEGMLAQGLIVRELTPDEVAEAREFMRRHRGLSVADAYALAMATSGRHMILTGARDIRELGTQIGLQVGGVLYVLDLIEELRILPAASLHTCLTLIRRSRARLPREDVEIRLQRYAGAAWPQTG